MEEHGFVLENKGDKALVRIQRHSLCSKCTNKCQLAVEDSHEIDEIEVTVENPVGAESGQEVKIEMGEQPLIIASLIIYILPLISLIIGYFAGLFFATLLGFAPTEGTGIIGSLVFLGLSFLLIKNLDKNLGRKKNYNPIIKQIIK
ncbi:MAG: SoxR reducing system RseC family protein [Halanaerobiales bacterium]